MLERYEHLERLHPPPGSPSSSPATAAAGGEGGEDAAAAAVQSSEMLKTDSPGAEEAQHPGDTAAAQMGAGEGGPRDEGGVGEAAGVQDVE